MGWGNSSKDDFWAANLVELPGTPGWGRSDIILKPSTRVRSRRWWAVTGFWTFVLLQLVPMQLDAQDATIQGQVRDVEGAAVYGATVTLLLDESVTAGTETDRLGLFRLYSVPSATYTVRVVALGYAEQTEEIVLGPSETLDLEIEMERSALELQGLSVEAIASRQRARFEELGGVTVRELNLAELRAIPGLAEADPVRAVEVLPGVVSTSDFSAGFHVRGGSQDQNLILLDGVPVFSPFHLGGLFSVFNVDMLDRVELQSGGFPAEHGGRVSSVLEIESSPGDSDFGADVGLSLLATRAAVDGRIPTGAANALGLSSLRYRGSARRSYFDVLLKPAFEFPYHLEDFQTFFEGWTHSGDRITLTAYSGQDVLALTNLDDGFPLLLDWDWGNDLVGLRWTHPRSGGGSLDVRANYSRYGTGLSFPDFNDTEFSSRIQQGQFRVDLDTRPTEHLSLQLGSSVERLSYLNRFATGGTEFLDTDGIGVLLGTYAQTRWAVPAEWLIELGVRFDAWGPDPGSWAGEPAPRLAIKRFFAGGNAAIKGAVGRYTQFVHSIRDEELPLGLDVWTLAGETTPYIISDQVQMGLEGYLGADWFWSLEGYVRSFDGVVGLNTADDPNDEGDDLLVGDGFSRGADLLIRKETGDVRGWVAASLLKAERTFPDPLFPLQQNQEFTYPPIFDRRLDLDFVLSYPLPWGWEGGLRFNLGTGVPYTRAVGSYTFYRPHFVQDRTLWWNGGGSPEYGGAYAVALADRNSSRFPAYHRLDFSMRRSFEKSWGTLTPFLNVLNIYNQRNPLFYFYEYEQEPPVRSGISMFPVLPTFGLEVAF